MPLRFYDLNSCVSNENACEDILIILSEFQTISIFHLNSNKLLTRFVIEYIKTILERRPTKMVFF